VHDLFLENCFEIMHRDFPAGGEGKPGSFGLGTGYVFESKKLVDFGVQWMEQFIASSRGSDTSSCI